MSSLDNENHEINVPNHLIDRLVHYVIELDREIEENAQAQLPIKDSTLQRDAAIKQLEKRGIDYKTYFKPNTPVASTPIPAVAPTPPLTQIPTATVIPKAWYNRLTRNQMISLGITGTVAATAAIILCAGVVKHRALNVLDQNSPDPFCEGPNDVFLASLPDDGECLEEETPCEAGKGATTLYGKVEAVALSQEAVSDYTISQETLLTAAATNELVSGLFADTNSWEDLRGAWKPGQRPLELLEDKLETWGGYPAVLASIESSPTPITSIDEALARIASDENLDAENDPNNSDQTALALAKEIALIQDARIAADPVQPEAELEKISPEKIEKTVTDFVATPPPSPAHFEYSSNAVSAASLYDAPEPMNLKATGTHSDPTPVVAEFEPDFIHPYDVPKPLHVRPVSVESEEEPEELLLDEELYEVPEPRFVKPPVKTDEAAVIEDFFKRGDAMNATAIPVQEPAKTLTEKAVATVKGWAGKVGKWFK